MVSVWKPFQYKALGERPHVPVNPALKDRAKLNKARKRASIVDSTLADIFSQPYKLRSDRRGTRESIDAYSRTRNCRR